MLSWVCPRKPCCGPKNAASRKSLVLCRSRICEACSSVAETDAGCSSAATRAPRSFSGESPGTWSSGSSTGTTAPFDHVRSTRAMSCSGGCVSRRAIESGAWHKRLLQRLAAERRHKNKCDQRHARAEFGEEFPVSSVESKLSILRNIYFAG